MLLGFSGKLVVERNIDIKGNGLLCDEVVWVGNRFIFWVMKMLDLGGLLYFTAQLWFYCTRQIIHWIASLS